MEQKGHDLQNTVNALREAIDKIADCAENLEYEAGWVSGQIAEAVELSAKTPAQHTAIHDADVIESAMEYADDNAENESDWIMKIHKYANTLRQDKESS